MRRLIPLAAALAVALTAPALARADAVTAWNLHASNALMGTAGQPPQVAVPHLAMVHGAVYDAVNAIDDGREGYLLTTRVGRPFDSMDAAVAAAAYRVLLHLVPAQQAALDAHYAAALAGIAEGSAKKRGIAVGEAAAAAMIAARTDDGRFGAFRFGVGSGPGVWKPVLPAFGNDPTAWLKDVRPFVLDSPARYQSEGPDALGSRRYAREFDEVKEIGALGSTTRTLDQSNAARYWAAAPHATLARIVRTVVAQQGVGVVESARLYAAVYAAGADTLITTWNDKAARLFWRPITAIREADTDGNSRTAADPTWEPWIATPPYPEHPSGLTSLTSAIVTTLQDSLGGDAVAFSDTHPSSGLVRSFTSLAAVTQETVDARVWSGIHFRNADEQGAKIGHKVARYVERHAFREARGGGRDDD